MIKREFARNIGLMVMYFIHLVIATIFFVCPIGAILVASRSRKRRALQRLRFTMLAGLCIGILVCVSYAFALHGRLIFTQVLLTGYLATSLMLLLQVLDRFLWRISRAVFGLDSHDARGKTAFIRAFSGFLFRAAVVFCLGIPFVLSTVMTYRPRVLSTDDPQTLYGWNFENVNFPATDGTQISGWWIPAHSGMGTKTVLLCPGSNSDKANQLLLVRKLVPDGYNVLVFDFRAHGQSGGQLCSFGDLERFDVLGAMQWLRQNHPAACRKVAGLGVSTGGAALLAAAADPSAEGQNIDVIAVYGSFASLNQLTSSLIDQFVPAPMSWFVNHLGLRLASYQVGADLRAFSPATEIKAIWPRPVLIIHGIDDELIPFEQGESLYDSAMEPKMNFWISRTGHTAAFHNDSAANLVRRCFDAAQRVI